MIKETVQTIIHSSLAGLILLAVVACGGDGTSNPEPGRSSSSYGIVTVSITDAAVDNASEVWVQFSGVTLQPTDGDAEEISFNELKNINLLSLQGTLHTDLIDTALITIGNYDWIRLHVNAENDGENDSYIKLKDGSIHELSIPSGSQSGLKINTEFKVISNQPLNMMIDFDLRKSIVLSNTQYKLNPVLRMVNTDNTGNIFGSIDVSFLTAVECSDTDPNTDNAVYLFAGTDIAPDDIDNKSPEPVSSAMLILNPSTGNYEYTLGFIPFGDYTLAFTCQADLDDPKKNDNINFNYTENITIPDTSTEPPVIPPAR